MKEGEGEGGVEGVVGVEFRKFFPTPRREQVGENSQNTKRNHKNTCLISFAEEIASEMACARAVEDNGRKKGESGG